jgi:uncharacterized membrane protein YfcA
MSATGDSGDLKPYTIDDHPKARRSIEQIRSWAALLTFALGSVLSIQAGSTVFDGVLRGLVAGVVMFVLAWGVSLMVWREIVRAEIHRARALVRERREKARQAILEAQRAAAERHAGE